MGTKTLEHSILGFSRLAGFSHRHFNSISRMPADRGINITPANGATVNHGKILSHNFAAFKCLN